MADELAEFGRAFLRGIAMSGDCAGRRSTQYVG